MMALRRSVMIGGIAHFVEDTVTGNPLVFTTDLSKPLKRLALSLLPRQSGSGDPSPSNIRPLLPWGEVGTWTGGKNLFPQKTISLGKPDGRTASVFFDFPLPVGTYLVSYNKRGTYTGTLFGIRAFFGTTNVGNVNQSTGELTITGKADRLYFYLIESAYDNDETLIFDDFQLEVGEQATAFTAYSPITPHPVNLQKNLFHIPQAVTGTGITAEMTANGEVWIHGTPGIQSGYVALNIGTIFDSSIIGKTVSASIDTKDVGIGFTFGSSNGSLNFAMSNTAKTRTGKYTSDGTSPGNVFINVNYDVGTIDKKYKLQFEVGGTPSAFQPYIPPVYGASIDLTTGEVWGTKGYALLNDPDKWIEVGGTVDFGYEQDYDRKFYSDSYTGLDCSIAESVYKQNAVYCRWRGATAKKLGLKNGDSVANPLTLSDVKTMAQNGQIAITYDIEPVLLATLTPQQVNAIVGVNTVWSDADGIELTFLKKG